jgi:hypothetical protein
MASMTIRELMEDDGMTLEQAEAEMARRVFGDHAVIGKNGPEERGIGSPWSIKHHPEKNRNHFANILKDEGPDAHQRALAQAGLKQAP